MNNARYALVWGYKKESVQKCVAHLYLNIDNQLVKEGVPHLTEHAHKKDVNSVEHYLLSRLIKSGCGGSALLSPCFLAHLPFCSLRCFAPFPIVGFPLPPPPHF